MDYPDSNQQNQQVWPNERIREQVRVLYMQAPISNIVLLIIVALFSYILSTRIDSILIPFWFTALFITASIRLALWFSHRKRPGSLTPAAWLRSYFFASAMVGLSWSIIYPLVYFSNDLVVIICLSMLVFGIAGASVIALSIYLPSFIVYTYPQILTIIFTLMMFEEQGLFILALGILGYLIMITLFTLNLNRKWLNAIDLQIQNTVLINDLNSEISSRESEIEQRTVELFEKNESLTREITERKQMQRELEQSEQRFQLAMMGANDGLYDWDLISNEIYYSPRWKKMLGYEDNELPNDFSIWEDLIESEGRERSWDMLTDYINAKRNNFKLEFKMKHKDGHWVDILSRAFLVRDETGEALRVVGTHVDISELKHKDDRISVFSQALEQSPVLVVITDTEANIEYVNRNFEVVTGYQASEVLGKNPRIFQSGLTPSNRYKEMWDALIAHQSWSGEIQNRKKNGEIYWEHAHIAPVVDDAGNLSHYVGVKEDITEKKRQEEKILYQAHYDSLTGLPNRFLALDRLSQSVKEASRNSSQLAVLFLDLDGFKRINDSLGHDSGDRLLIMAAQRLSEVIREEDHLCRLGGDEFIVILQNISQVNGAQLVAENLLHCFKHAFVLDERELIVTASIGIAIYPQDGSSSSELLRNADTAMYYSKEQGRNTFHHYTKSMNLDLSRRLSIEEQLSLALENGELSVLFQPLYELSSQTIIGVEALIRWNNDVLGQVSPDEFIPIAEQTGVIDEIGEFVLNESISWNAKWHQISGSDFMTAVNISPSQFRDPDLSERITEILQKYQMPASALELEITEGVLLSGYQYIDETIDRLKKTGVGISMDDFGTGYSSLSYLRSYPFSTLKIDRSFINDISIDKADRMLINAAISMGHGLGLKIVAEGIETEEQLSQLIALGCDIGQGFLLSKPVTGETISKLLKSRYKHIRYL